MSSLYALPKSSRQQDYTAIAGQAIFGPANFLIFDLADIKVLSRPVGGQAFTEITTGWTASLSAAIGFPTVTFAAARTAGETIRISSRRVHDRTGDVSRGGSIKTTLIELELDKQTTVLQELRRDVSAALGDAALALSQVQAAIDGLVPPGTITGLMLAATAIQDRLGYIPVSPTQLTDATTYSRAGIVGPAYLANHVKMSQRADMRDWNTLDTTGTNDNASLVNQMLVDMKGKGPLWQPPGIIVLGAPIDWPENTILKGIAQADGQYTGEIGFFHLAHSGVGFRPTNNIGARRAECINTYRTQPAPGPGFTPANHDFDWDLEGGQGIDLVYCTPLNASRAFRVRGRQSLGQAAGRIRILYAKGQPLITGFDLTHATDVVTVHGTHFWPVWNANPNVFIATRAAAVSMVTGRLDNPKFGDNFFWGYQRGWIVNNQGVLGTLPTGTLNQGQANQMGFDNCGVGLLFNTGADGAVLHASHVYAASDPGAPSVTAENLFWCLANNTRATFESLFGQYTNGALVALNGSGNVWNIGKSRSKFIDLDANGTPEFSVDAGNTLSMASKPETSAGTIYGGAGNIESPDWRAFTPNWSSGGGAFGSLTGVSGRYRRGPGNTVTVQAYGTVSAIGAASGEVQITNAPINSANDGLIQRGSGGRDNDGKGFYVRINPNSSLIRIGLADTSGFAGTAGASMGIEITYQTA